MMNKQELLSQITKNTLIFTPNKRLSASLLKDYAAYQAKKGVNTWETPQILPIQVWILGCWQAFQGNSSSISYRHLSAHQEALLWEKIISDSDLGQNVLKPFATAKAVQQSFGRLLEWEISIKETDFNQSYDTDCFKQWALAFQLHCQTHNLITSADIPKQLIQCLRENERELINKIFLLGFDELTPTQQSLFSLLSSQHIHVEQCDFKASDASVHQLALDSSESEIVTAACWAKQSMAENKKSIGIVIPDLSTKRLMVEKIFDEQFDDHGLYNISAGCVYSQYPVIHSALTALTLNRYQIEYVTASTLLRSPFLGLAESEMTQRATLDAELRSQGEYFNSLK